MKVFFALFFATVYTVAAQPQVPHKIQFAGMTLTIRDDARKEIQKDVNALTQSPKHHNIKVERARTYFPIIEKVFEEEHVPDDFKYLVLQESALIPDAVSSSNAVGFWQFKDFTALEMGLRVDKVIDERMNIVASSHAAARYIKKNNFYFNNWVYALQAYQMGAGGVMKSVAETESGLKHMEITGATYWYVKKFLAHKIAFEEDVKGMAQVKVLSYETHNKKKLADIADEVSVDEEELKLYNKWTKTGVIPDDRSYTVLIPVAGEGRDVRVPAEAVPVIAGTAAVATASGPRSHSPAGKALSVSGLIKINGIDAIKAKSGENPTQLASRANVDLSAFLKWNDISISDRIEPSQYYLLGKKRTRSVESYHKVTSDDNLWKISQQYGLQLKKLKRYNNISSDNELTAGMTLWLSSKKPKESDAPVPAKEIILVDNAQSFAWAVDAETPQSNVSMKTVAFIDADANNPRDGALESPDSAGNSIETVVPPTITEGTDSSAATSTDEVAIPPNPGEHTVVAGETLYGIATHYKVGVMDLVGWNNLSLKDGIKPGQVIKLSGDQPVEDQSIASETNVPAKPLPIEHEVKSTDTLYSVARKYNVTIQELMEWNNKKDFNLSVGEKLKIQSR